MAPSAPAADVFACTSGDPCVHITFPDGGHDAVDVPASVIDDNADIEQQPYAVRTSSGNTGSDIITGLSLRSLLTSIIPDPIDADSVTYTLARNPVNLHESPLQAGDLDDPSPFAGRLEPAFDVQGSDSSIEYIRPQRENTDVNGPDDFQTGSITTTIDLQVRTQGALLHPTVSVGSGPFVAGDSVPFTASFPDSDPPHQSAEYEWTYAGGDPAVAGQQSTKHVYDEDGTYTASVAVSGDDPNGGSYFGQSDGVTVQIGKAPTKPGGGKSGGSGTGSKHHPKHGPNKGHGHHAGGHSQGGPTAHASPTATPSDNPGATGQTAATPSGTSGSSTAAASSASASTTPSTPATAPTRTVGRRDIVRGILIDGPVAGSSAPPAPAATRAAASARRPSRLGTPFDARWLWLLVPVALLVAGVLGERRRVPRAHGRQSRT